MAFVSAPKRANGLIRNRQYSRKLLLGKWSPFKEDIAKLKGLLISGPQNQRPHPKPDPRGKTTWQHASIRSPLTNTTEDETRIKELEQTLNTLAYHISKTATPKDLRALHDEYTHTLDTPNETQEHKKQRESLHAQLHTFAATLTNLEDISTFDAATFHTLTKRITVNTDVTLSIEYTNGTIISPRSR